MLASLGLVFCQRPDQHVVSGSCAKMVFLDAAPVTRLHRRPFSTSTRSRGRSLSRRRPLERSVSEVTPPIEISGIRNFLFMGLIGVNDPTSTPFDSDQQNFAAFASP